MPENWAFGVKFWPLCGTASLGVEHRIKEFILWCWDITTSEPKNKKIKRFAAILYFWFLRGTVTSLTIKMIPDFYSFEFWRHEIVSSLGNLLIEFAEYCLVRAASISIFLRYVTTKKQHKRKKKVDGRSDHDDEQRPNGQRSRWDSISHEKEPNRSCTTVFRSQYSIVIIIQTTGTHCHWSGFSALLVWTNNHSPKIWVRTILWLS